MSNYELVAQREGESRETVRPDQPGEALVSVRERIDDECFEASFALQLSGLEVNGCRESSDSPSLAPVLEGMSAGQELLLVYSRERNGQGALNFKWHIRANTLGADARMATDHARSFQKNLDLTLAACAGGFHFTPVTSSCDQDEIEGVWQTHIEPRAVALSRVHTTTGDTGKKAMSTVLAPLPIFRKENRGGSLMSAILGSMASVQVNLAITAFELTADEQQLVNTALNVVRGGATSHRARQGAFEKTHRVDPEQRDELKQILEEWLKHPCGFRLSCTLVSSEPLPAAFISMVAGEVFQGRPVSIRTECLKASGKTPTSGNSKRILPGILKLSNCVSSTAALPGLFPATNLLLRAGVSKHYLSMPHGLPTHATGQLLGYAGGQNSRQEVRIHANDRSRHCYVLGATGTGKSTLLYNMIEQDIDNGDGVCLIDPHGDLYRQVLQSIPANRIKDVVLIDPCDIEHPVGINFLECRGPHRDMQMNFIVNEMMMIFERLYDMRICGGPVFELYMRNALLLAMTAHPDGATLMEISLLFEEKEYRDFLLNRCDDPVVKGFWLNQAEETSGDQALANVAPYITSKINQFTGNALLRPMIGQVRSTIDFRECMDAGKIVLVNLSKGFLGEKDTQLLGMLLIGKIFNAAMGRARMDVSQRRSFYLYVDEFQNFTTDTVACLVSEARKFGLHLILANQNLSQIAANNGNQNILDTVLGNMGTMLFFRMGVKDAGQLEAYTSPDLCSHDLQNMPDYHVAARLLSNNAPVRPFVFRTLPDSGNRERKSAARIIKASRKKYARTAEQVKEEIFQRRRVHKRITTN